MCGIFGYIRQTPPTYSRKGDYENFIEQSFITGQLRGPHGSGIFAVRSNDPEVLIRKAAQPGADFAAQTVFTPFIEHGQLVVGHNRFSTSGKRTNENCHPFKYKHLVGVHNGTISHSVLKELDAQDSHEVDSARVFSALNAAKDPLEVLPKINFGAYVFLWYDFRKNSMFLFRNSERSLSILKSGDHLLFASEAKMLLWLAQRNKLCYSIDKFYVPDVHTLYQFPLDDLSQMTATPYTPKSFATTSHKFTKQWDADSVEEGYLEQHRHFNWSTGRPVNNWTGNPQFVNKFETFFSWDSVMRAFPLLQDLDKEFTTLVDTKQTISPNHSVLDVALISLGKSSYQFKEIRGVAVHPVTGVLSTFPVSICASPAVIEELAKAIPSKPDEKDGDMWYPVFKFPIDTYKVLPTGDVILSTKYLSTAEESPSYLLGGISDSDKEFVTMASDVTFCNKYSALELRSMWDALKGLPRTNNGVVPAKLN